MYEPAKSADVAQSQTFDKNSVVIHACAPKVGAAFLAIHSRHEVVPKMKVASHGGV